MAKRIIQIFLLILLLTSCNSQIDEDSNFSLTSVNDYIQLSQIDGYEYKQNSIIQLRVENLSNEKIYFNHDYSAVFLLKGDNEFSYIQIQNKSHNNDGTKLVLEPYGSVHNSEIIIFVPENVNSNNTEILVIGISGFFYEEDGKTEVRVRAQIEIELIP